MFNFDSIGIDNPDGSLDLVIIVVDKIALDEIGECCHFFYIISFTFLKIIGELSTSNGIGLNILNLSISIKKVNFIYDIICLIGRLSIPLLFILEFVLGLCCICSILQGQPVSLWFR